MTYLLLTVRFLDDRYHGLLDRGGPPEWPPSPFRLFQALVAGVARRGDLVIGTDTPDNSNFTDIGKAIGWLQKLSPPIIIAPKSKAGQAITRFVPNNDGDKKFDRQERLTAKPTVSTLFLLEAGQKPEVYYLWDISNCADAPVERVRDAARSLTALGWGIDMAFADADRVEEAKLQSLKGIRWYPKKGAWRSDGMLRIPTYDNETKECTLCDLRHCHHSGMNRIEHGNPLKTVDKPKVFDRVLYTSTERPIGRPQVAFKLLKANEDPFHYPHTKLIHIAGMLRNATIKAMATHKDKRWVETMIAGHKDPKSDQHEQLSYVPLPSIGHEYADAMIRRVMIVAPFGEEATVHHLSELLDGVLLTPEVSTFSTSRPMLQRIRPDSVTHFYLDRTDTWQTVTPVILPRHNDHKPEKTAKLIQRALEQSGIETPCEFTWQSIPFFKNTLSAHKYDSQGKRTGYFRPSYLDKQTAIHLRIRFGHRAKAGDPNSRWVPIPVAGPLLLGCGRHCGFGLFAAADFQQD